MSCYIILDNDDSIFTVSGKDDTYVSSDQTKIVSPLSLVEFVDTLPAEPWKCKKSGDRFIRNPDYAPPVIYDADVLIAWGLTNVIATIPAELIGAAVAAFLDFANKATDSSRVNFLATASLLGLTAQADTIIAKAIELGASLS